MEFGNIGGIALILASLVWLAVFVPSWARRSELRVLEHNAKNYARNARGALGTQAKLSRTRAIFSSLAALGLVAGAALAPTGLVSLWLIGFTLLLGSFSALVAVAAHRSLGKLAAINYEARQLSRERVSRKLEQTALTSGWTPNPLPKPLNAARSGELIAPSAEIIQLSRPVSDRAGVEPTTQSLNSGEIVEILKRRRAI